MTSPYDELTRRFHQLGAIKETMAVLEWDNATMMPRGGMHARSEQLTALNSLCHDLLSQGDMEDLLLDAEDDPLEEWQHRNLELMKHSWLHKTCVPDTLSNELMKKGIECEHIWREARKDNDFERYLPYQQEVLQLVREVADIKGDALDLSPYDALLDQYDPGRRSQTIDGLFSELAEALPPVIEQALNQQPPLPTQPTAHYPIPLQRELAQSMMKQLGFDFNHGRLDESLHPFCGGIPDDVRITTRYDEGDFLSSLMGICHETGHALYEQNLPRAWRRQPIGDALGMSMHESMSLFIEMQLCRSHAFFEYAAPIMLKTFGGDPALWHPDTLYQQHVRVDPSLIRVDADEVTYPCHVMIRYEIEKALIEGKYEFKDVPDIWSARMMELLNQTVKGYAHGCMQDIHWTDGAFGYFPTYTLGALMASAWRAAAEDALGPLDDKVRQGEFQPIIDWLKTTLHAAGSRYTTDELLERVTGKPLDISDYMTHIKSRYLG